MKFKILSLFTHRLTFFRINVKLLKLLLFHVILMTLAIIKTGGKQYLVKAGDKVKVEKLAGVEGDKVNFDALLLAEASGKTEIGKPLASTKISGKILAQGRKDKVLVVKYKAKTRFRKRVGHRQPYTLVQIEKI